MASWYVYSGAAGAGTGADWANAYTTLAAALSAKSAGDTFYVADDHAETQASTITLTSPGTQANHCKIICVLRSGGSVPPVSADLRTTATVSTTTGANITFGGVASCYGVTFQAGSTASVASINLCSNGGSWILDSCLLEIRSTNTSARINFGGGGTTSWCNLINTPVKFANASQCISGAQGFTWERTTNAVQGTVPTTLISPGTGGTWGGLYVLQDLDLSALGSGCNLINISTTIHKARYEFTRCKLGASVSKTTGSIIGPETVYGVKFLDCDSADSNWKYYFQTYWGIIQDETTIKRTSGANDGTTGFCHKMVSAANVTFYAPCESEWIAFWNETVGSSVSVTIPIVTDNVTLKDNEAWIEVEYLGDGSYPIGTIVTDRAADILNAGTNQTTDSTSTWTTTGLTTPVKQELSVAFTPQEKGLIRARVCLAKASTTMYYDPKILSTSGRQYQDNGVVNEGASGSGGGLMRHPGMLGGFNG